MNKRYYFVLIVIVLLGIASSSYYSSMKSAKVSSDMSGMEGIDMYPTQTSSSTNKVSSLVNPASTTKTSTTTPITPKTYSVSIQGFPFSPKIFEIKVGDTVVWTNKDGAPHTVTSDTGNELASVNLGENDTYSHTFTKADIFNYHCSVHPGMKATIIVR